MKFKKFLLVGSLMWLSSCTVNVDRRQQEEEWRQARLNNAERPSPDWVNERSLRNCPIYALPEARTVPPVPAEEYRKARGDKREEILLAYIEQLRTHIKDTKSDHTDRYLQYLMACTSVSKPK